MKANSENQVLETMKLIKNKHEKCPCLELF